MSESMQQAPQSLERMRQWHEQYRAGLVPSPLEDINQLGAKLDLTHAHPSGIAQLFAGGRASLDLLFRDNGMLRAANRRLERVLDEKAAKLRVSGGAELSPWESPHGTTVPCRCCCIRYPCKAPRMKAMWR